MKRITTTATIRPVIMIAPVIAFIASDVFNVMSSMVPESLVKLKTFEKAAAFSRLKNFLGSDFGIMRRGFASSECSVEEMHYKSACPRHEKVPEVQL